MEPGEAEDCEGAGGARDYAAVAELLKGTVPEVHSILLVDLKAGDTLYSEGEWEGFSSASEVAERWNADGGSPIVVSGVRHSVLQRTEERLVATSVRGQGHLVGARGRQMVLLARLYPRGSMDAGYMQAARALASVPRPDALDPELERRVLGILDLLAPPSPLIPVIRASIESRDADALAEIAGVYDRLREIFGL
jgi:hypothetical protein